MNELIVLPNPPGTKVGPTGPGPDEQEKSRLKRQSWRRLGLAACALALMLGTGWAVGTKTQSREAADSRGDTNAARKLAADEAERGDIRALREEIRALFCFRIFRRNAYFKLAGFSGFKSFGTNWPSLRINSPSNQISPPPHSGRWISTMSQ